MEVVMFKRILTSALVFGMAALAPPARAQSTCAPRTAIAGQLERQFGELPLVLALRPPAEVFELWVTPGGGTWSLLVSTPEGLACILAAGPDWLPAPMLPTAAPVAAPDMPQRSTTVPGKD
jgi:hypothetical protein